MFAGERILRLNVNGLPVAWLTREEAASYYAKDLVAWVAGESVFHIRGGFSRLTGEQTVMELNSIIAIKRDTQTFKYRSSVPPLNNDNLFLRDRKICMYCGNRFTEKLLSRDHIIPVSKGGQDVWTNVVTSCKACNGKKGANEPHEVGMQLLALPYEPNFAETLMLSNKRITADQMAFLESQVKKSEGWTSREALLN